MKTSILTIILISLTFCVSATNIKGTLIDKSDGSPLISATVELLAADSTVVKGTVSDVDGQFLIKSVNPGNYILRTSYVGYTTLSKRVKVADATTDLGRLEIAENTVMLRETEVVAQRAEVKVMQDTVEYNAGAYKTQPNAVVEDLLKRLPGVEVSSDGKITAQGKEVTKILVDGKEFFSDDAKVASRNIPVDMVDKLQVIDRKSDLARLTGVDDGEDETVINLTVKEGMKKGWFGNATAGYGTDGRYSGNFMVNRFTGENQYSFVGDANNINAMSFSMPGANRFNRFGGTDGVNNTQNFGFNFNVGNEEKFRAGGDVMYSHSRQRTVQNSNKQYLFTDSTSYENSHSYSLDRTHNFTGNFRLRWQVDSLNTLDFRPSFVVSHNESDKTTNSELLAGDAARTAVNSSDNITGSKGTSYDVGGELVFNHKFRHPGRSFSTQVSYKYSNTNEDETALSINQYFLRHEDDETRDQTTDNHRWNSNASLRLTWTEPLGDIKKARFLTFSYRVAAKLNNADKLVYNIDRLYTTSAALDMLENEYGILTNPVVANAIAEESGVLDEEQSNRFRNTQVDQQIRVGFKKNSKKYRLDAGISVNPSMMKSENLINNAKSIPERWVWNYSPYLRYRYTLSKTNSLAIDYRGRTSSPSMTQLQPVPDESNPSRIVVGNPSLLPSFAHNISVRYNNFSQEKQRSIMAFGNIRVTQNSIVSKTVYDSATGKQTTTYDNVNGVWSADGMMMYTSPIGNRGWRWSNNVFARFNRGVGFNNGIRNHSTAITLSETPSIAFRTDAVDLELRPYYNFQQSRNSIQTSTRNVHTYGGSFNANYYTPIGLSIGSDVTYSASSGYSDGYDNNQWLWNASLSYEFLKNKSATLAVKAYDLLQQKKNVSRSVTANYIEDRDFNTVTRYFMVTFSYKFTAFAKGTTEKDINYDGFGPGGPGRDGGKGKGDDSRRRMGPPPGGMRPF